MSKAPSERAIVTLVGAVQFVNVLDFMMVMPLGPDFSRALGIPLSTLGYIGGSYTAAASVAGLAGSFFLDRFDRRKALALSMLGLVVGTALGGLAQGLGTLLAARILAGLFGGPATSLSLSIIADVIPIERRGKAMGAVMGAFSIASVLGVPAGLELARLGTWRTPFFAVAALGALLTAMAITLLPPLRGHLRDAEPEQASALSSLGTMLGRPTVRASYALAASAMMGLFVLVPHISSYVQRNLGFPRGRLGLLYMVGGVVSFAALRLAGRLVDRFGCFRVSLPSTALTALVIYAGFYRAPPLVSVVGIFALFMCATGFRNVSFNTLLSRVPSAAERARFMSILSAVQHAAGAAGSFLSARILTEDAAHRLVGMPALSALSIALLCFMPPLVGWIESRVAPPRPSAVPVAA